MKKVYLFGILVVLAVVLITGYSIFNKTSEEIVESPIEEIPENPIDLKDQDPKEGTQEIQPKLSKYTGQKISYLGNDPLIDELPKEAVDKRRKLLSDLEVSLSKDPNDLDGWMTVAFVKKFFNNYEGARDAWEFAKMVVPNNPLPYINLGTLYGYYFRDLEKAEGNFLAAVRFDFSNSVGALHSTALFYKDFGMKEKALELFRELLRINPDDEGVKEEIRRLESDQSE